ncbi:vWA domain-containing protein [Corallococcus macrosporus]|uniref:vWA domain-containing protein n=1 Tax=Corallococcus macrosporus TaxID=35 RepID=UPI00241412B5|nr:VWA domain-containing protein [Corallococcus macrosporus]
MTFTLPQAWLLLLPLGLFLWRHGRRPGPPMVLRWALLVLGVGALAGPELRLANAGSDVAVVVDRSRSMPLDVDRVAQELISLVESQRRPGDRVGVITYGREARVESPLSEVGRFGGFTRPVDAEASDLSAALDARARSFPLNARAGCSWCPTGGPRARMLGARRGGWRREASRWTTGRCPVRSPRWTWPSCPWTCPPPSPCASPSSSPAVVQATSAVTGTVRLERDGKVLVKGRSTSSPAPTCLPLRDLLEEPGLVRYRLTVEVPGDGVPENDVGVGVLRVEGPPRVLLLTSQPSGTLAKALSATGMEVDVKAPFHLSLEALDGVGVVVLENVDANALGETGLNALADYVDQAGGGLVMTGGRSSFGEGGYRRSPVEPLLPVSLEMREEQRRASVAMSVLMDSSCSMGMQVPDGRTKMELAAEGVTAALTLLNANDEASVHMVDTEPHESSR